MKFADAINPTDAELRAWAAQADAMYPDEMPQDWDLVVANWQRVALIVELAADESCPQSKFFLGVLYLMAGDCVRTAGGSRDIPRLRDLLRTLQQHRSSVLQLFRMRAEALLDDPSSFEYEMWCGGGYANE